MADSPDGKLEAQMEAFKEWVRTLRQDISTMKTCVENDQASVDARVFPAAALNYLVTRMDLIPDWEPSVGVLDDAMVLRILVGLGMQKGLDDGLPADAVVEIGRLSNEIDTIQAFLGDDMFAALRKYSARLTDDPVRNRTPKTIAEDAEARTALYAEVEEELLRTPPAPFSDTEKLALKFKSYLQHKLTK